MSIVLMMSSNHLILCCPLLLPPSIFPSIRGFSDESVLHIRWPKYWSFNFSISPSSEYSGLISYRITGLISLQSKGLSRVFSNTAVQKDQFLNALGVYNVVLALFQDSINNNHMIHQYHLDEHKFTTLFAGLVGWLARGWLEGRCWARTGQLRVHKCIWVSYKEGDKI